MAKKISGIETFILILGLSLINFVNGKINITTNNNGVVLFNEMMVWKIIKIYLLFRITL